jgi:para-nitrobenzyl esterase
MAKVGNAIVVLPAFRLGNFGFLALPSLTAEGKGNGSGGYGFLDQLAALQWVKRNIAAFGGDPAQVTIAGQSSGGTDVCGLMASPAANGLYSRAIVESGLCGVNVPLAAAEKAGSDLAAKLGCGVPATAAACLREKPADQILDAAPAGFPAAPSGTALLPEAPLTAFADGKFQHVPMVIGFTRDEWWPLEHAAYPMDEAKFKAEVTGQFKNAADKVMSLYPVTAYPHIEYALGAIRTDVMFACPAFALADAAAVYAPVSMYEFADRTAPPFKSLGRPQPIPPGYQPGAFHTAELQYLLGYKAAAAPLNPDQLALADKMIHLWTGFARGYADSGWNAYSKDKRVATILQLPKAGDIQDSVDVFAYHKCDYWNG